MNSSRRRRDRTLAAISPRRAERLVLDWVNLQITTSSASGDQKGFDACRRMRHLYPDVFSLFDTSIEGSSSVIGVYVVLATTRDLLQAAWATVDRRKREWLLFKLRDRYQYHKAGGEQSIIDSVPERTAFEDSIYHFQTISDRARFCLNPDCHTPYFLAKKKGQKYCCDICAQHGQREAKRKWWDVNRAKKER